jgi:hypothetical protein
MRNHLIVSQQAWLGMGLAMAVTILAIPTRAAPSNCEDGSAAPIPRGKRSTSLNTGMRTKGRQLRRDAYA